MTAVGAMPGRACMTTRTMIYDSPKANGHTRKGTGRGTREGRGTRWEGEGGRETRGRGGSGERDIYMRATDQRRERAVVGGGGVPGCSRAHPAPRCSGPAVMTVRQRICLTGPRLLGSTPARLCLSSTRARVSERGRGHAYKWQRLAGVGVGVKGTGRAPTGVRSEVQMRGHRIGGAVTELVCHDA